VASAETLAFAVASGEVGDPRSFKRPVRVTVPRALPTDDVLVARRVERFDARTGARRAERPEPARALARAEGLAVFPAWKGAQTLELVERGAFAPRDLATNGRSGAGVASGVVAGVASGVAVVCGTLDEVRYLAARATEVAHAVRAVLAPYIPSSLVALLSAAGIAALRLEPTAVKGIRGQKTVVLPPPSHWPERQATLVAVGSSKLPLTWLAQGEERAWATGTVNAPKTAGTPSAYVGAQ
jgi:aconitate hydratase